MDPLPERGRCPDCETELVSEGGVAGLCPQCLLSLALLQSPARTDAEVFTEAAPSQGRLLGERYQIRELLGRGGMGEVYRAFDLKLRVDVALKAVRPGRFGDARARELLRREVRAARGVVSPNVCRIFDLVDEDGQELVSMEYVDGETLAETLRRRGPLELEEAREVASQFLAGLEAIHRAGLVHRDFKPENVMLTRAGRVVVMDFGVARAEAESARGTVSGTPGYMPPEQAGGDGVDARADVFAAGVVLAEMVSAGGARLLEARQRVWREARETPPRVPEGPWAAVLRQCLSPNPAERPPSAHALARALEGVTQRLPGQEEKRPYPGLSSFTEAEADYFFGREAEVEAVWKKLKRPRLLALIGPSGAGKSSFLRAGLLRALPSTWASVRVTPGTRPFQALAQALVPHFSGDTDALQALVRFEDQETALAVVSRWRSRHEHAVVVVDQFEELFTQNPKEVQAAFAALLGRLVLEADAHVVLSLRDDFLIHCHAHEALAPAFSELTPLGPLTDSGLRRALVQPALACGYRFEDEALVDEMVGAVRGERGALPLLAFAASRLFELRDRERGLLTWEAYRHIGGVAGALAQHAEATLERIGSPRTPLVRELFRNLVTAEGTRAVQGRGELLSVFGEAERGAAGEVLDALVDARLLTQYDRAGEGGVSRQTVEIVHESLLNAWPRLVRWRTQDEAGAQLRDQLRQAARLWDERGRAEDLLWTGASFREFALWRERHPQPLTTLEDDYGQAMTARATRRRRLWRIATSAVVATAAAIAFATSTLWRQADAARAKAEAEGRRSEASKLLALAQLERDANPTTALAWVTKSLELADSQEARTFALALLQSAPTARLLKPPPDDADGLEAHVPVYSPDGKWLAVGGYRRILLASRSGEVRAVGDYPTAGFNVVFPEFGPRSDVVVGARLGDLRAWSVAEGGELWRRQGPSGRTIPRPFAGGILTLTFARPRLLVHTWPLDGGEPRSVGVIDEVAAFGLRGSTLVYLKQKRILSRRIDDWGRVASLHGPGDDTQDVAVSADGRLIATIDGRGEAIGVWAVTDHGTRLVRNLRAEKPRAFRFDRQGRRLIVFGARDGVAHGRVFDLDAPPGAEPLSVLRSDTPFFNGADFDPSGEWLATGNVDATGLWHLAQPRPHVFKEESGGVIQTLAFTPDGRSLVAAGGRNVRVWALAKEAVEPSRLLLEAPLAFPGLALDPTGALAAVAGGQGRAVILPLAGGAPRELPGFSDMAQLGSIAFAEEGRLVVAAPFTSPRTEKVLRVWDLATGETRAIGPLPGASEGYVGGIFLRAAGGHHVVASVAGHGLVGIDIRGGLHETLVERMDYLLAISPDARTALACHPDLKDYSCAPSLVDLQTRASVPLGSHGARVFSGAFDRTMTLVATGSQDGTVRVGPISGESSHFLAGHKGMVRSLTFSPDGRWLASAADDRTIRLWPLPDMSRPPWHARPRAELLETLRSHTNVRAVPDATSPTGYRLEAGPFPGWERPTAW